MTNPVRIILHRRNLGAETCAAIEEYSKTNIKAVCSSEVIPSAQSVIRWGTTAVIPGEPKVWNKARAIHATADKGSFRLHLAKCGLAPVSVMGVDSLIRAYESKDLPGPWVIRPVHHQRSENFHVCRTIDDAIRVCQTIPQWYASQMIDKKNEYRVFVCQGRVVWMIEKIPKDKNEVSWGCVSSGQFKYVDWSDWNLPVLQNAVRVMAQTQLDFGAVDIMVDQDGNAYCAEVNTAPFTTPYYQKRTALAFDFMVTETPIEPLRPTSNWRDYTHPTLEQRIA